MAWLGIGAALASGLGISYILSSSSIIHYNWYKNYLLALKSFLGGEAPPNKVLEVKNDCYAELQVLHRDDAMRLYQPNYSNSKDRNLYFEIVIERPHSESVNTSYSLYRAKTIEEAEEKFTSFFQRLPVFVKIVREVPA